MPASPQAQILSTIVFSAPIIVVDPGGCGVREVRADASQLLQHNLLIARRQPGGTPFGIKAIDLLTIMRPGKRPSPSGEPGRICMAAPALAITATKIAEHGHRH